MNRRRLLVLGTTLVSALLAGCSRITSFKPTDEISTFRVESDISPLPTTEQYIRGQPDLGEITLWAKLFPTATNAHQNLHLSRLPPEEAHRITTEYRDAIWIVFVAVLPEGQRFTSGRATRQDDTLMFPHPERTGSVTDVNEIRYVYTYYKIRRTIPFTTLPSNVSVSMTCDES